MLSFAISRAILVAWFAMVSGTALAAPPRVLREPVLGLRYAIAKAHLDRLPVEVLAHCPTMENENIHGRYWVFASAHVDARTYYVVGGYGIRSHPEPPNFPQYEPYDFGSVFFVDGDQCADLGSAREVFDTGAFGEDMPQTVLQLLASDLAVRLARACGGPDQLRAQLRRQHANLKRLSPELHEALKPYSK